MADILDHSQFDSLVCGDAETFTLIVDDYELNATTLIKAVADATADSGTQVKDALHQLKGSSGMLGMSALYERCAELESIGAVTLSDEQVKALEQLFVQSVAAARDALSKI
ncbi:Hpt domain-containing protein [Rubritalea marina]|uniref:Hpt domain-containing protein n=1 Tax=Rubritalea marina TaxID=361055 RepID=UPI00035FD8AE|nr:Hpt domain-containing protein [Rubritalea marina]